MGVRLGRHARGLSLIFSRRHIVATSTPLHGHCLVQYCDTNMIISYSSVQMVWAAVCVWTCDIIGRLIDRLSSTLVDTASDSLYSSVSHTLLWNTHYDCNCN